MCQGIGFSIPNEYGLFFKSILAGVKIRQYTWRIDEDEVYIGQGNDLFSSEIVSGIEFERIISSSPYYAVFAKLQAFTDYQSVISIESYGEFRKSDCQILVLVCDNVFVNVFCKNADDIEAIRKNAAECGFTDIRSITQLRDDDILKAI